MMATTRFDSTLHLERWRPLAYVTIADPDTRARVLEELERAGWMGIAQPTGVHLLDALAGLLEGNAAWRRPELIVCDVFARGVAGVTIAQGLRDLGIAIPILLIAPPNAPIDLAADPSVRVADIATVVSAIAELVRAPPWTTARSTNYEDRPA